MGVFMSALIFMKRKLAEAKPRPSPKARSRKREQNKDRTKQAILKAALDLFSRKGFHVTTTKAISKKAGIAEGTLFNYFPTKEDLALYFLEQEVLGLIQWFEEEKRLQRASLAEKLFAIIHHLLERIEPYEDFIGAVYLRALQPSSKLCPLSLERQEINLRYLKFIRGVFEAAEAKGEVPHVGDVGCYGFALFQLAMMTHWLHDRSAGKQETLALLDRCLKIGTGILVKGGWEW
jgi:AcrR family transcriptional regulator